MHMDEGIDKVKKLKVELTNLGYYPYQVKRIIKENYQSDHIENLAPEQVQELAGLLEEYVSFARKCWKGASAKH